MPGSPPSGLPVCRLVLVPLQIRADDGARSFCHRSPQPIAFGRSPPNESASSMSSPSTASTCVDDEARSSPGTARAGSTQQPGGAAASAPKAGSPLSQQRQAGLKTIAEGVGGGVREVSPPAFARGGSAHRISAGILGSPYHAAAAAPYNRSLMGRHVAGGVETEVTVQMVRATGWYAVPAVHARADTSGGGYDRLVPGAGHGEGRDSSRDG